MKAAQRTFWAFFSFLALSSTALAQTADMELPPLPEPVISEAPQPGDAGMEGVEALPPLPEIPAPDAQMSTNAAPATDSPVERDTVTDNKMDAADLPGMPSTPTPALSDLPKPPFMPDAGADNANAPVVPEAAPEAVEPVGQNEPQLPDSANALPLPSPQEMDDTLPLPVVEPDAPVPPPVEEVQIFDIFNEPRPEEPPVQPVVEKPAPPVVKKKEVITKGPESNIDLVPPSGKGYRLPGTIYQKQYSRDNRHLPKARYEVEYDAQLFVAVANDHVDAVRGLLARGRNPNMQNAAGESLATYAIRHGASNSLRLLFGRGANPDAVDARGLTPLFYSMVANRPDYTRIVLEMGADPNLPNDKGVTPLMYAATKQDVSYVKVLLAAGAEPNLATFDGRTPLHVAAEYNNAVAVQVLAQAGAFINAQKLRGTTPLMSAAAAGSSKAVDVLLAIGADTHLTDHLGRDAVQLAKAFKQPAIANQVMTVNVRREMASMPHAAAPAEEVAVMDAVPLAPQVQ